MKGMKRGTVLSRQERFKIITGVKLFKKSYRSLSKEFNCSITAIRNVVIKYDVQETKETQLFMGHKNEPYWDNEWCYGINFNPLGGLKYHQMFMEKGK